MNRIKRKLMDPKTVLIEEYKELQHLRDVWSKGMGTWGQIFIPISIGIALIFLKQYPESNPVFNKEPSLPFLLLGLGLILTLFWRGTVRHIDQQVLGMYPRMLEIEKELEMEIQATYYFRNLNEDAKNFLAKNFLKVTCDEIQDWDYRTLKEHFRGHHPNELPHTYLLKVWDEFRTRDKAPIRYKLTSYFLPSVNYSVTTRGHGPQNLGISSIWVLVLIILVILFV